MTTDAKAYSLLTRNDAPCSAQWMMDDVDGFDTMAYSLAMNGEMDAGEEEEEEDGREEDECGAAEG